MREIAELPAARISDGRKDAADQRLVTRELMVQFPLIDRAAVNAVTLRADGLEISPPFATFRPCSNALRARHR
jgi:hypothetical protein